MKTFILIILNFIAAAAAAQTRGYATYIRIGYMALPDAENVTGRIVNNITGFNQSFFGIGGEMEYKVNKNIIDAELMVMSSGPTSLDSHYEESFTGAIMFKTGYLIAESKNVFIYPSVGAGISSFLMNTYIKTGNEKERLHTIYLIQPAFDLGLNGDIIIDRFKNGLPTGALPVGLRAGYRFAPSSDNWKRIDGAAGMQKNKFSTRGWYVSIALGIGYYASLKK